MAQSTGLPSAKPILFGSRIVVQPPLTRLGSGPGLFIVRPAGFSECQQNNQTLDPEPLQKWAEEGFTVAQITLDAQGSSAEVLRSLGSEAKQHLLNLPECTSEYFGLIGSFEGLNCHARYFYLFCINTDCSIVYGSQADYGDLPANAFSSFVPDAVKAVVHFDSWESSADQKSLSHATSSQRDRFTQNEKQTAYFYPDILSSGFIVPGHPDFKISTAGVAHTRSLAFVKGIIGGPYFDLEKIWDEHTYYEFGERSVEKTMATMVQEPYVNHVPTVS